MSSRGRPSVGDIGDLAAVAGLGTVLLTPAPGPALLEAASGRPDRALLPRVD